MHASRKHFLFVIHGARADRSDLRHLVSWVREKGHVVTPRVTWEAGDASRFAAEAASLGVDAVVAAGGDGTVHEVVQGLSGSSVPMGIIPLGTANDFARQVGIPPDADHAMDVILRRKPVRIDSAELNGRRFLNVSAGGVGAEATAETSADAKEALGALSYVVTGARKLVGLQPRRAHFQGPGLDLECDFLVFAVGNARMAGGGTLVTPRARLTDGLLDLLVVEARPRQDFVRLVLRLKRGEHLGMEGVHYHQLPAVRITSTATLSVNLDGEPAHARRLDYRVRPRDLVIHLPSAPDEGPGAGILD